MSFAYFVYLLCSVYFIIFLIKLFCFSYICTNVHSRKYFICFINDNKQKRVLYCLINVWKKEKRFLFKLCRLPIELKLQNFGVVGSWSRFNVNPQRCRQQPVSLPAWNRHRTGEETRNLYKIFLIEKNCKFYILAFLIFHFSNLNEFYWKNLGWTKLIYC